MKEQFNSTRDKQAAAYFSSEEFLNLLRDEVKSSLVNSGRSAAHVLPRIAIKPQDMPYILAAFQQLKKEYPELDHIRLNTGVGPAVRNFLAFGWASPYGGLAIDTKKNTFGRRFANDLGL